MNLITENNEKNIKKPHSSSSNEPESNTVNSKRQKFVKPVLKKNNSKYLLEFSIVIPLFNEEESLLTLAELITKEATDLFKNSWEAIFVDDGSTDNSFTVIKQIIAQNKNFKCIRFRRNFGKSAALSAGFSTVKGKYVATMDADLQDDPKEFKNMFNLLNEGFDLVSGWKKKRHDPISKTLPSKFFNFVTSVTSGIKLHDFNCGIKMYKREVVDNLEVYGEMHRYLPALAFWNGFKVTEIPVEHHERKFGKSKFGMARFIRGFLDLLTVVFTTRYLKRPMHFFGLWGTICSLVGAVIFAYLCIEWLIGNISLSERPLGWFSVALIVIGIQLFSIGLIGELLVKQSHSRTKNYVIKTRIL